MEINALDLSQESIIKFKAIFPEKMLKRIDNGGISPDNRLNERIKKSNPEELLVLFNRHTIDVMRFGNVRSLKIANWLLNNEEDGKDVLRSLLLTGNSLSSFFACGIKQFAKEISPLIGRNLVINNTQPVYDATYDIVAQIKDVKKLEASLKLNGSGNEPKTSINIGV